MEKATQHSTVFKMEAARDEVQRLLDRLLLEDCENDNLVECTVESLRALNAIINRWY